jgi:hypothetical protein
VTKGKEGDNDADRALDDMRVEVLARDEHGAATRVRVACDRRAPLAALARALATHLPPRTADARLLTPLRFRGTNALLAATPLLSLAGVDGDARTIVQAGITGASVRLMLWDGVRVRDTVAYRGPAARVDVVMLLRNRAVGKDTLPAHVERSVSVRETHSLEQLLHAAVDACSALPEVDLSPARINTAATTSTATAAEPTTADTNNNVRWHMSVLSAQRATSVVCGTRHVTTRQWSALWPTAANVRALCDAEIADGTMLALEPVVEGDAPVLANGVVPPRTAQFVGARKQLLVRVRVALLPV